MNDKQSNKFNALDKVSKFWKRVAKKVSLKGKVVAYNQEFDNILGAIEIKSGIKITGTTSYTSIKDEKKNLYMNCLIQMLNGLSLIAHDKDDAELTSICKMNVRKLVNMRSTDFKAMSDAIKSKATQYKTDLLNENLDEDDFADLESCYSNFTKAVEDQSESGAAKIAATTSLVDLFKRADKLIEEFDKVVKILEKKNPEFRADFDTSKTVKNLGIRHSSKSDEEDEEKDEPKTDTNTDQTKPGT